MAIIYRIDCVSTGLSYVGQTGDIKRRLISHRYNARHGAHGAHHKLYNSIKDHGWDNHRVSVIEHTDQPDDREIHYINELDTLNNGLNSVPGGGYRPVMTGDKHPLWGVGHTEAARAKIKANHAPCDGANNGRARCYDIHFVDGRVERVKSLKTWAVEHGYNKTSIRNVIRGKRVQVPAYRDIWEIVPVGVL